MEKNNSPVV